MNVTKVIVDTNKAICHLVAFIDLKSDCKNTTTLYNKK